MGKIGSALSLILDRLVGALSSFPNSGFSLTGMDLCTVPPGSFRFLEKSYLLVSLGLYGECYLPLGIPTSISFLDFSEAVSVSVC